MKFLYVFHMFLSLRASFCRCDVKYAVWTPERDTDTRGRDQMLENSHWCLTSADKPQRFHLVESKVHKINKRSVFLTQTVLILGVESLQVMVQLERRATKMFLLKSQNYLKNLFFNACDSEVVTATEVIWFYGCELIQRSSVNFRDTDLLTVRSSGQIPELTESVNGKYTNSPFIYSTPNLHLLKSSWSVDSTRQVFSACQLELIQDQSKDL